MSKTLLLADDSVTIQKVVGISFASEDVTLLTVDNGDDAIARAREARPDLVLADVVMPGKNGYEVCEAIKTDPELRHIPVILLTGTFEAFDEERAQQVGAASHVAKPFEAQTLVDEVRRLLAAPPAVEAAPARQEPATAAPQPAEPVASAPDLGAPPTTEDSFDFFDDDLSEFAPPRRQSGDSSPPNSLDLDFEGDAIFALADEEPSERAADAADRPGLGSPSPLSESPSDMPGDHTVAILPEEEPPEPAELLVDAPADTGIGAEPAELLVDAPADTGIGAADLDALDAALARAAQPRPEPPPAARPHRERIPLDFDLGPTDLDAAPVEATQLTHDAVVDPKGVSGFAISSSDLGDAEPAGGLEEPPVASMAPPPPPAPVELADTRPRVAQLPALEAEPIADGVPLDEVMSIGEPADEPAPASAQASLDAIAPQLREQLHDTLEKIAWESFSDVTEKIVRQAVERVEQIAWEVIPHMAEALVREEIRRMKGEK